VLLPPPEISSDSGLSVAPPKSAETKYKKDKYKNSIDEFV